MRGRTARDSIIIGGIGSVAYWRSCMSREGAGRGGGAEGPGGEAGNWVKPGRRDDVRQTVVAFKTHRTGTEYS